MKLEMSQIKFSDAMELFSQLNTMLSENIKEHFRLKESIREIYKEVVSVNENSEQESMEPHANRVNSVEQVTRAI